MKCYCDMDLDELKAEYGRINRAHVTVMAALAAYKISYPKSTKQVVHAFYVMDDCENHLKALMKAAK
ncbi:unnamed protein product [marine sediment metagenome]|uniref:Uncharacterized protein n=1 Tax=marine sediment metagenome TaxID=412755 RepID=X1APC8_9ZZZZ